MVTRKHAICAAFTLALVSAMMPARASDLTPSPTVRAALDFDATGTKLATHARIAYITQCVNNPYCQATLQGIRAAAAKYGFEFKIFDANFSAAEQLKQVENASAGNFDAFIFAPIAAASGCALWKQYLQPKGKPVVTLDLPMCGDNDYTPGLAGTVTVQTHAWYDDLVENAFESCGDKPCTVATVGAYVGSDIYNMWEMSIKKAEKKHPNVHVVVDQPGNYDPQTAMRVAQDALRAHPEIDVFISNWDDMSRGIAQAITYAGKKPGTDVRIYSTGAQKDAVTKIKAGIYNSSIVNLPYEEGYYAALATVMALEGKPLNGWINEDQLPPITKLGSIFMTKANADKIAPKY
jgi:ABC-type sugar transport system substrate-binding protein